MTVTDVTDQRASTVSYAVASSGGTNSSASTNNVCTESRRRSAVRIPWAENVPGSTGTSTAGICIHEAGKAAGGAAE